MSIQAKYKLMMVKCNSLKEIKVKNQEFKVNESSQFIEVEILVICQAVFRFDLHFDLVRILL